MPLLDRVPGQDNLYIGGIFSLKRTEALKEANITHVLSVIRLPLDMELFAPYIHKVVEVDDVDDENLLEHFPSTCQFIEDGLKGGGGVLVHCAMGKSRSAACVIAFLMQKYHISPQEALTQIQQTRPLCDPNLGFMRQLDLYHSMKCTANIDEDPQYQRWLYRREVEMSVECGRGPEWIRFEDEVERQEREPSKDGLELKCRKCRRTLATSEYLVPHTPRSSDEDLLSPISSTTPSDPSCAQYFIDPLSWMKPELEQGKLEGRLECPKCKSNVGKYAWQGLQCSCGQWVVPGVSLIKGKIDEAIRRGVGGPRDIGIRVPPTYVKPRDENL